MCPIFTPNCGLKVTDQNHLMFLKVYLKPKQISKDGSHSYCNEEIKERFVNIALFLPQMTILQKNVKQIKMYLKKTKKPATRNFFFTFTLQFSTFCDRFKLVQRAFLGRSITILEVNLVHN